MVYCEVKKKKTYCWEKACNILGFLFSPKEVMNNLQSLLHMHGWTLLLVHLGRKKSSQVPKIQSSSMRNSVLSNKKKCWCKSMQYLNTQYCSEVWDRFFLMPFKEVSYAHQDCIYLIKITGKTLILWIIITVKYLL